MNRIILTVFACLQFQILIGQKIMLPEFSGQIGCIMADSSILLLEQQRAQAHVKGGYYSKVKGSNYVKGSRSRVVILSFQDHKFLLRVNDNSQDPFSLINIFKLESDLKDDVRKVLVSTAGAITGQKQAIEFIAFKAVKYGLNGYLIEPTNRFQIGEYAITLNGSREVFNLFSIQ